MILISGKHKNYSDIVKIDLPGIILKNLFSFVADKYKVIFNILREKITLPLMEKVAESLFLKESQEYIRTGK